MWADWLASDNRLTCHECRDLAEANDSDCDCENCPYVKEPSEISKLNLKAIEIWRLLDLHGRGIDGFSGVPLPLKIESLNAVCERSVDPEGIKRRVILLENAVYKKRLEKFNDERKKSGKD